MSELLRPGETLVKMPTIEEADILAPLRESIAKIAARYAEEAKALPLEMPEEKRATYYQRMQRQYYAEIHPYITAASDRMLLTPMIFLVVPAISERSSK